MKMIFLFNFASRALKTYSKCWVKTLLLYKSLIINQYKSESHFYCLVKRGENQYCVKISIILMILCTIITLYYESCYALIVDLKSLFLSFSEFESK